MMRATTIALASLGCVQVAAAEGCELSFETQTNLLKGTATTSSAYTQATGDMAYLWSHERQLETGRTSDYSMIVMYALPKFAEFGREPVARSDAQDFRADYLYLETLCQGDTCFDIPTYVVDFNRAELADHVETGLAMTLDVGTRTDTIRIDAQEIACFLDATEAGV